jgi:hypothetical protein
MDGISRSFGVISLLHLANDRGLEIKTNEDTNTMLPSKPRSAAYRSQRAPRTYLGRITSPNHI